MMNTLKKILPDVIVVVLFAAIAFAYFAPADIEGRILYQHDSAAGRGAGQEAKEYRERTGDYAMIAAAKDKMYALAAFLEKYENEFGLLDGVLHLRKLVRSKAEFFGQKLRFTSALRSSLSGPLLTHFR